MATDELPKRYDPKEAEKKWQAFWEKEGTYTFHKEAGTPTYSIDTPPPTVSGNMHIGHAFSYAQGDFIARFQRMLGKEVFYPFGTDDNGLPTEHLVERLKNVRSTKMPRSEFVALCHDTIKEIKPAFVQPWKELGISANFIESYSTIDPQTMRVSQKSFLDLYHKKLIYRAEKPITWCTKCQTAIAQAEFENIEKESQFTDIAFHDQEGNELIIATTRPELIPACVALFAHPDDERYTHLQGSNAHVPLFDYTVPILFDETVAMDVGTGLMMVCTFGDKEDVDKWQRYGLDLRIAISADGTMSEIAGPFSGMKSDEARAAILESLEEKGHVKAKRQIRHNTNVHERDGTPIEFMITTQWFINVMDHKDILIRAADAINWYPQHMKTRYVHWVQNLGWDWCISRQRHFGVPFPVWYEKDTGNVIVAKESDLPIDPSQRTPASYEGDPSNLIPESDVMDTWATSSVTPQIALQWANVQDDEFIKSMPMSLRMQAHDIIRTWAFYTIVKSQYHHKLVPWKNIMISGHALDPKGKKMSKSRGNVVDPLEVMKKFNADALRYWAAGSRLGDDLPFQEKDLLTGNKTITKLFNASKFSIMHLQDYTPTEKDAATLETMDRWILAMFSEIVRIATLSFKQYEYARAKLETDTFFWHTLCDNYLEIIKGRLYNPEQFGADKRESAQYALYTVLLGVIKLFAPIMPHITEEIYQMHFRQHEKTQSIHKSLWPTLVYKDEDAAAKGQLCVHVLSEIRKYKSAQNMSLGSELGEVVISCETDLSDIVLDLQNATKSTITFGDVPSPTIETDTFKIFVAKKP